jgi:hypothetical protein
MLKLDSGLRVAIVDVGGWDTQTGYSPSGELGIFRGS